MSYCNNLLKKKYLQYKPNTGHYKEIYGACENITEIVILKNTCSNHVAGCSNAETGVGPS
jgi:hypothetical protein